VTAISHETFEAWRTPRFGTENPTRLDNPLWESLIAERISAYHVNKRFGYERSCGGGATWCFERFGQTTTKLDDGRTLYIGGEHEDNYDPDFYIYNDVVVVAPDGAVAIYGYPCAVFPPTDFHTATLDGDLIWIIGSLGYSDARKPGTTQTCRLDLGTMAIEQLATVGESPGWIHGHDAQLSGGVIVVRGGKVEDASAVVDENIDEWAFELGTSTWTRRTARDWQRWSVRRTDGGRSLLWELRQMKWDADHPHLAGGSRDSVRAQIAGEPDLALVDALYRCDGATELPRREEDAYDLWRIELDGVVVRFTEESRRIAAIVEGRLAEERLRALQDHVVRCASALHFTTWQLDR
jgi:hypothetical protein